MIRRFAIGTLTAGALLLLPTAGLAAMSPPRGATTVTAAIKAQDKIVSKNPEFKQLKSLKVNSVAEAKAAIPKLKSLQGTLNHAAGVVSGSTATSSQKTGKAEWVKAVREEASSVGGLATGLEDIVAGHKSAGEAALAKADTQGKAATVLGDKADKLLGLPAGD